MAHELALMKNLALRAALGLSVAALISSCKIMPNNVRSGTTSKEVDTMLDADSIHFTRNTDQKSGSLTFNLKDQHSCRIEYWAQDPSGTPPPSSPLTLDCPKETLALNQSLEISGLTPGFPLSFRIYVWPKTTTFLTHYVKDFAEGQDLKAQKAQDLIVVRYLGPRQSAEIYSFRSPSVLAVADIKSRLGSAPSGTCVEHPAAAALPFPRASSLEDSQKRPFLGLSSVKTEGFGSGQATVHPFFATRMIESFEQIARQENWKWNFAWENQPYSFESFPPGYIGSLNVGDGANLVNVNSRNLSGAVQTVEINSNVLKLQPRIIFPTEVAKFDLTVKSADANDILFSCQFAIDKDTFEVPQDLMSKLAQGSYQVSFTFETSQIHYNEKAAYPPWIITAQDVIQFRLNKRL